MPESLDSSNDQTRDGRVLLTSCGVLRVYIQVVARARCYIVPLSLLFQSPITFPECREDANPGQIIVVSVVVILIKCVAAVTRSAPSTPALMTGPGREAAVVAAAAEAERQGGAACHWPEAEAQPRERSQSDASMLVGRELRRLSDQFHIEHQAQILRNQRRRSNSTSNARENERGVERRSWIHRSLSYLGLIDTTPEEYRP
ncbi:uncharacterized protein LOC144937087 isoform X1 [Lampetra fluviatilis]